MTPADFPAAPPPFFAARDVAVLTAEEMRAWDERAIGTDGVPQPVLMENAGRAAAAVLQRLYPDGRVVAAVGSGNNGGDAMVALRALRAWGRDVAAVRVADRLPPAALLHGWEVPVTGMADVDSAFAAAAVLVDGLLGTGASGAPRGAYADAVAAMNRSGRPILAIDGPSGIDFTTGEGAGEAVCADVSVTFGAPKRGLLRLPGRAHAGRIVVAEIGFPPLRAQDASAELVTAAWAHGVLPPVPPDAHKGTMGRVVIVAGRRGMAGACVLSGRGALRAGAGMAVLVSPDANRTILQTALPEALFVDRDALDDDAITAADAIVAGPAMGTGDDARDLLRRILRLSRAPLVLDADAVTLLAHTPDLRDETDQALLLTPHPGEMGRLLGRSTGDVVADPFAAAEEAAARLRCAVLLKGSPSLVATPGRPTRVSVGAPSGMATGGSGDVLSGICGAMVARGMDPRDAAGAALWFGGRAAVIAGRGRGLVPTDTADALPAALLERPADASPLGIAGIVMDLPAAG